MVSQVRSFNRIVTERIGALHEHFLARRRPLGQARLLWEIGAGGCDVRMLRSRLGLDSGYLSRLLRSLEHDGLVESYEGTEKGRNRRYYRISKAGHQALVKDRAEWQKFSRAVTLILKSA